MTTEATRSEASQPGTGGRAADAARPPDAPDGAGSSLVKLGHEEWSELCADLESWVDE